jgi:hypothetical protein
VTGRAGNGMPVAMPKPPDNKLSLEWIAAPDGMALFFDKATWKVFKDAANSREQSPEHMILRAVVACLGTIMEDNLLLNRMLRPSAPMKDAPDAAHESIAREIAADIHKAQARCLERGWMRARADGRLEITESGEKELFQFIAELEAQTRH